MAPLSERPPAASTPTPGDDDVMQAAYESLLPRAPGLTFEAFKHYAAGWEVIPLHVDAKPVGAILINGPEVHALVKPEGFGRWCGRRMLARLQRIIAEHGQATTHTTPGNVIGEQFVRRLGFVEQAPGSFVKGPSHGL